MQQLSEMYRVSLGLKGLVWETFELCRDIDAFVIPIQWRILWALSSHLS